MGINVGYLMLIFLLLSVLGSIGTDVGLLGITRAALVLSLYPALLLFPTSLLLRQWKLASVLSLPALGFMIVFGIIVTWSGTQPGIAHFAHLGGALI